MCHLQKVSLAGWSFCPGQLCCPTPLCDPMACMHTSTLLLSIAVEHEPVSRLEMDFCHHLHMAHRDFWYSEVFLSAAVPQYFPVITASFPVLQLPSA